MLKKILITLVVIVVVFVIVVATRSAELRVARSVTIAAPAEVVFNNVSQLKKWQDWSPWAKIDPNCKWTYEGPESGKGASYSWDGNNDVGAGKLTITDITTNELIRIHLEFIRPFAAVNTVEFTFKPKDANGTQTEVTWAMSGKNNFMAKAFALFVNMDKMVGKDFEKGLAQMKVLAEETTKK